MANLENKRTSIAPFLRLLLDELLVKILSFEEDALEEEIDYQADKPERWP